MKIQEMRKIRGKIHTYDSTEFVRFRENAAYKVYMIVCATLGIFIGVAIVSFLYSIWTLPTLLQ